MYTVSIIAGSPACAGRSSRSNMWYVYFLKSTVKENWFYVGSTNRLEERVSEHNSGKVKSTKQYRPLKLIYSEQFFTEKGARETELMYKKKRIAKEEIIRKFKED